MSGDREIVTVYPLADYQTRYELGTTISEAEAGFADADGEKRRTGLVERMGRALEEATWAAMTGASRHRPQRSTAIRLAPGGRSFETVELDDAGNVIEPPPRCYCTVIHRSDCPNRFFTCA